MKNEIREAYERMNPPRDAKERMIKNIMKKQNKGRTYYTAAPGPERWWTAIPAALALIAVLVIGWQFLIPRGEGPLSEGLIASANPTETTPSTELEIPGIVDKIQEEFPIPEGYAHVIGKYIRAYEEDWSVEEYMQSDICYVLGMQDSIWEYGYALMDLNGDGIDELIITDGSLIYDLYILMEDGGAGHIISAGERARYYLCEGNIIGYRGSGGAANTVMEFFRVLPSGDFQYELKLEFDDGTWYTYKEYGKETPGGVDVVSEEQAQDLINGYGPAEIVFQSFLRPEQGKELIYPRTYKQLLQELMVKNSGVINMVVAYTDVTGDGIDDLLLGSRGADSFGHVYSIVDGVPKEILTYGSDIGFTLCKNGVICHHQADKPFGEYTFISLKNDEYQIIEHLTYDSNTGAWTRKKDSVTETITDAQKQEIVDSYGSLSLNWMGVLEAIGG